MNRLPHLGFVISKWLLGGVMLTAAISKIVGFREFVQFIEVLPSAEIVSHSRTIAELTIAIELVVAMGCLLFDDCIVTGAVATLLLVGFTIFQFVLPKLVAGAPVCPCIKTPLLHDLDASFTFRIVRNLTLLLFAGLTCALSPGFRGRSANV